MLFSNGAFNKIGITARNGMTDRNRLKLKRTDGYDIIGFHKDKVRPFKQSPFCEFVFDQSKRKGGAVNIDILTIRKSHGNVSQGIGDNSCNCKKIFL